MDGKKTRNFNNCKILISNGTDVIHGIDAVSYDPGFEKNKLICAFEIKNITSMALFFPNKLTHIKHGDRFISLPAKL